MRRLQGFTGCGLLLVFASALTAPLVAVSDAEAYDLTGDKSQYAGGHHLQRIREVKEFENLFGQGNEAIDAQSQAHCPVGDNAGYRMPWNEATEVAEKLKDKYAATYQRRRAQSKIEADILSNSVFPGRPGLGFDHWLYSGDLEKAEESDALTSEVQVQTTTDSLSSRFLSLKDFFRMSRKKERSIDSNGNVQPGKIGDARREEDEDSEAPGVQRGHYLRDFPTDKPMIVIPDLHGDFTVGVALLLKLGVYDLEGNVNKTLHADIVQLGDINDRGPSSPLLYEALWDLKNQLRENGHGASLTLLYGNHETMIMTNHAHYMSTEEFEDYYDGDMGVAYATWSPIDGVLGRSIINTFKPLHQVGDLIFVHAGLMPASAVHGEKEIVARYRKALAEGWLKGHDEPLEYLAQRGIQNETLIKNLMRASEPEPLLSSTETSLVWTRELSKGSDPTKSCALVRAALDRREASTQIVGHTITRSRKIELLCDGTFICLDTGASRWIFGTPSALVIYLSTPLLAISDFEMPGLDLPPFAPQVAFVAERKFDAVYLVAPAQRHNRKLSSDQKRKPTTVKTDLVCFDASKRQVPCHASESNSRAPKKREMTEVGVEMEIDAETEKRRQARAQSEGRLIANEL